MIEKGLVVYFGVAVGDDESKADYLAKKIANLRVFCDENGKMNLSAVSLGYSILAVSQFTLLADVSQESKRRRVCDRLFSRTRRPAFLRVSDANAAYYKGTLRRKKSKSLLPKKAAG